MSEGNAKRGTKRKRSAPEDEEDLTNRVSRKLHHSIKEIKKSAKKAKAFETQKLVKRLKTLRKDSEPNSREIEEVESQLKVLKNIDHERIGNKAIRGKLRKDKILSQNEAIASAILTELPLEPLNENDTHDPKLDARLLSSRALSSEVNSVILALRSIIRPDLVVNVDQSAPAPLMKDRRSRASDAVEPVQEEEVASDQEGDSDGDDGVQADDGWESGTIDDEHSTDKADSVDGSTVQEVGMSPPRKDVPGMSSTRGARQSTERTPKASSSASTKPNPKTSGAESTFLPSLSVGFTRGDSDDSDWSDHESKQVDHERKNRRGQRARRAIWEKKYGRNAKHLKHDVAESSSRSNVHQSSTRYNGSNTRNNPAPSSRHPEPLNAAPPRHPRISGLTSTQREKPGVTFGAAPGRHSLKPRQAAQEERPLHPSWEAKKKMKHKDSGVILPSQSKRIKFD